MPNKHPKPSKRSIIELKLWAKRTTMEGVPNMVESASLVGKVFWGAIMVIFMCALLFHFVMLIEGYFASNVSSEMNININSIAFPDVTLCSLKPVAESLLNHHTLSVSRHLKTKWDFFNGWLATSRIRWPNETSFDFLLRVKDIFGMMMEIMWSSEDFDEFLFSDEFSILDCKFNGVKCVNNSFTLIQHSNYWNCYTFKPQLNQANYNFLGDAEAGLSMNIFTDDNYYEFNYRNDAAFDASLFEQFYTRAFSLEDYLHNSTENYPINGIMARAYEADGVKVIIHHDRTYPLYGEAQVYRTYIVQNGMSATLRVEAVERNRVNTSTFTCYSDLPGVKYTLSMNSSQLFRRTRFDLHAERVQNEVKRLCGCYTHRFPLQVNKTHLCYYVPEQYRKMQSDKILNRIECHDKWYNGASDELNSGTRYLRESDTHCTRMYKEVQLDTTEWPNDEDAVSVLSHYFSQWLRDLPSKSYQSIVLNFSSPDISSTREYISINSLLNSTCGLESDFKSYKDVRNAVSRCINYTRVSKNLLRVNVRIASLGAVVYLERNTYDKWELMSEIGGVIGLWFGISFMTLFEICELMVIITLSREPGAMKKPRLPDKKSTQGNQESLSQMDEIDVPDGRQFDDQQRQQNEPNKVGYTIGRPLGELNVELSYISPKGREKAAIPLIGTESPGGTAVTSSTESDAADATMESTVTL